MCGVDQLVVVHDERAVDEGMGNAFGIATGFMDNRGYSSNNTDWIHLMQQYARKPNFFIIGAPKCGTTSLAHYLGEHPDIFMSYPKEPFYFCPDVIRTKVSSPGWL